MLFTTTTDYISGIQYTKGKLAFIQTEEGRALPDSGTFNYEYTLADHLGNSRLNFDSEKGYARVNQQDDYMPFGMEIAGLYKSPKNEYLYNKKELQLETGLYDYGARFYDPVIARWTTVDPLAEVNRRSSPYNYVLNNPIRLIDPDGLTEKDDVLNDKSFEQASDIRAKTARALASSKPPKKGNTIVVLNSPKGAHGAGHMAALIQGKDGRFSLYSKNGTNESSGLAGPSDKGDQTNQGSFSNPEEFMVSSLNPIIDRETGEREYSEGYVISGIKLRTADEIKAINGELSKDYCVEGSNCATTVQAALRSVGVPDGTMSYWESINDNMRIFTSNPLGPFAMLFKSEYDEKAPNEIYKRIKQQNKGRV